MQIFFKKAKIRDVENLEKHFISSQNYTVNFYQFREKVLRPLRLEETKRKNKFKFK